MRTITVLLIAGSFAVTGCTTPQPPASPVRVAATNRFVATSQQQPIPFPGVPAPTPYRVWIHLPTGIASAYRDTEPDPPASVIADYQLYARYQFFEIAQANAGSLNQFYGVNPTVITPYDPITRKLRP